MADSPELDTTAVANAQLRKEDAALLVKLSDPEAAAPIGFTDDPARLQRVLSAAEQHGVLPIVLRKWASVERADAQPERASLLQAYQARQLLWVGQSLLLERHATTISAHCAEAGLKTSIVKGPVFASLLYPERSDRPFTDVDFLFPPADLEAANRLMPALGFALPQKAWDNSRRDQEYKWVSAANRSILIEFHGDLVHYPMLRRQVSFGYERLAAIEAGVSNRPAALLMTAIVHAACGHKFQELKLLVDVLQGARRVSGAEAEEDWFVESVVAMGARLEAAVTLHLVARLFDEPRAAAIARRFGDHGAILLGNRLIQPEVILAGDEASRRRARVRRHAFRVLQQVGFARP